MGRGRAGERRERGRGQKGRGEGEGEGRLGGEERGEEGRPLSWRPKAVLLTLLLVTSISVALRAL